MAELKEKKIYKSCTCCPRHVNLGLANGERYNRRTFASHCRSLNRSPFKNRLVFSFLFKTFPYIECMEKGIFPYYWVRRVVHQCQWSMFHKVFDHHIYVCVCLCLFSFLLLFCVSVKRTGREPVTYIFHETLLTNSLSFLFFCVLGSQMSSSDVLYAYCFWYIWLIEDRTMWLHNFTRIIFWSVFHSFHCFWIILFNAQCDCFLGWLHFEIFHF